MFFQREVLPGEVMVGDFTEFYINITGIKRKIFLWVTSLPFSNSYFATRIVLRDFLNFILIIILNKTFVILQKATKKEM